jgi:hypothetical protein
MIDEAKPLRPLSYYTTCTSCDDEESDIETVLEGVGEYCEESNTIFLLPCPVCKHEMEVSGWLEECDECGEFHYDVDKCEEEN